MATWTKEIVNAMESIGGSGSYRDIYAEVERVRSGLSTKWKATVRRTIQIHSSDSQSYQGGDDLFFSVDGLGRGVWGLRAALTTTPAAVDLPSPPVLPPGSAVPNRVAQLTYRVLRDTSLARKVKLLHRDECQICGETLRITPEATYSEAHHIIPLGRDHNGPDTPGNVIVLCPNHHALCDYGAIQLDRSTIRVAAGHVISESSITYHNERIFGSVV